jgi:hypothetical protein
MTPGAADVPLMVIVPLEPNIGARVSFLKDVLSFLCANIVAWVTPDAAVWLTAKEASKIGCKIIIWLVRLTEKEWK